MPSADERPDLAYRWSGPSTPGTSTIVLLHGLGDSGDCWPDAVRRWSPHHRIVGVDLLGHGASPRFTPAQLASADPIEEMCAATERLVQQVAASSGPVVLVGHSMGAGLATALAARRSDLVRAVVLEEPAWRDPADRVRPGSVIAERVADCRRFAADPAGALSDARRDNPLWPEVELEPWAVAKAEVDLDFLALGVASFTTPWEPMVAALTVPTLVLVGAGSDLLGDPVVERARALRNPRVRIELVEQAGHCVRRDRPEAYHALVDPFIALPGTADRHPSVAGLADSRDPALH
jgi:pimeloyl-ACP methyl ester carboxylesterase